MRTNHSMSKGSAMNRTGLTTRRGLTTGAVIGGVVALLVVGAVLYSTVPGFRARTEVAATGAVAKIDKMLGEIPVKKQEISNAMKGLKDGIANLRKAKIKAQVKHDQLEKKVAPLNDEIARSDEALKKLRTYLETSAPVELAGKEYSQDDLKKLATEVITKRKSTESQIDGYRKAQSALKKVVDSLARKQADYETKLASLETQMEEIDAKYVALKAMKDAADTVGEGEDTLSDSVAKLEKDVADLYATVEVEMQIEDEKWASNDALAEDEISGVDNFINATTDTSDTIGEIDAILGGSKDKE